MSCLHIPIPAVAPSEGLPLSSLGGGEEEEGGERPPPCRYRYQEPQAARWKTQAPDERIAHALAGPGRVARISLLDP